MMPALTSDVLWAGDELGIGHRDSRILEVFSNPDDSGIL